MAKRRAAAKPAKGGGGAALARKRGMTAAQRVASATGSIQVDRTLPGPTGGNQGGTGKSTR